MPKTITLRLDDDTYQLFREAAKAEKRSIASMVERAALSRIRELQFIDDYEMENLLANENLLRRLRSGSGDARERRGHFVDE